MRLDDLARTATESLLADTVPDTEAGLADLKRTRRNRSITRTVAAGLAVAVVIGGWSVLRESGHGKPEPAGPPTFRNGALLIAGSDIRVVSSGGERLHLPDDYRGDGTIAFTADGSELLYANPDQRIAAIDVTTGATRVVMPCSSLGECRAAPSPDGRWLAQPDEGGILLREVSGDAEELLTTAGTTVEHVTWSPDGKTVAFSNLSGIFTMPVTGSAPRPLVEFTDARPVVGRLQWSPDGSTIAFVEARPLDSEQPGLRPERFVLRLVRPDGSDLRDLHGLGTCMCVRGPGPDLAWAPDGTAIAVTRVTARPDYLADARSDGVHLVTLDGQAERIAGGPGGQLAWQPVPAADSQVP